MFYLKHTYSVLSFHVEAKKQRSKYEDNSAADKNKKRLSCHFHFMFNYLTSKTSKTHISQTNKLTTTNDYR